MRLVLPAALAGLSLLLGGGAIYEAVAPLPLVQLDVPHPARHASQAAPPVVYAPPSPDLFADIDARPLFTAARKPLMDSAQANGAAGPASDFALVGVIMGGDHSIVLLRSKSTSLTTSTPVGGIVNGWRVTKIDATTVTLRANGSDVIVPMDTPSSRPPSAPLEPLAPSGSASAPPQPSAPPPAASPPAATPPLTPAQPASPPPGPTATAAPPKPAPARTGTISPEALRSAPINPQTGEPTL